MSEVNVLFNAETTNTTSDEVTLSAGGDKYIIVSGTMGGATVQIEIKSPTSGLWVSAEGGSFTESIARVWWRVFDNTVIRAVISGGTSASITVEVTK
jgi:hypothetical protein